MQARTILWPVTIAAALLVGCETPVVPITHTLGAAEPLPADINALAAGTVQFTTDTNDIDGVDEALAPVARRILETAIPAGYQIAAAEPSQVGYVKATIHVDVTDRRGTRVVRRWDRRRRILHTVHLDSLVRLATMRVIFEVTRSTDQRRLLKVETQATFDSLAYPRLTGKPGDRRPDDPAGVPSGSAIAPALLADCMNAFAGMLVPLEIRAHMTLRPTWSREGRLGLTAADHGRYQDAVDHFSAAVAATSNDAALLFNLAVVAEAVGDLDIALDAYTKARMLQADDDPYTLGAIERVRSVRNVRQQTPAAETAER